MREPHVYVTFVHHIPLYDLAGNNTLLGIQETEWRYHDMGPYTSGARVTYEDGSSNR